MLHQHRFDPEVEAGERETDRLHIRFVATVDDGSAKTVPVRVMNVSRLGFMALCDTVLPIGALVSFSAPNGKNFPAQIRWALEGRVGCRFQEELGWEDVLALGIEEPDDGEPDLGETSNPTIGVALAIGER